MGFLWFAGPVAVVIIYLLTMSRDKRRADEADAWAVSQRVKRVPVVPSAVAGLLDEVGAGTPLRVFEIIPKVAYLGVFEANAVAGSDHQTVFLKLENAAPAFTIRPLPIVDGNRITNVGVPFAKHAAFAESFLVEGDDVAAIKRWLTRPLRKALLQLPDLWVRVDGKLMTVTLYGTTYTPRHAVEPTGAATSPYREGARPRVVLDSMRLQDLVTAADALFAEHGAEGAPSLLLEEERDDAPGDDDDDADEPAFDLPPGPFAEAAAPKASIKADPQAITKPKSQASKPAAKPSATASKPATSKSSAASKSPAASKTPKS
jgi:hypothetical protein